ncbi:MAG: hypothetical protein H0U21_02705 [Acidimicrobiia bacterium]|nr:hypothetical protein [Acidimicrobiia bacterium]
MLISAEDLECLEATSCVELTPCAPCVLAGDDGSIRTCRGRFPGVFAARRRTYRVLYRVDEVRHEMTAIRIDHRRDVSRS